MYKRVNQTLVLLLASFFLSVAVISCKSKTSDTDVKTAVDNAIASNSNLTGVNSEVNGGVVTLSGEVKDDAARSSAETTVKDVKGVKSVVNNLTVAAAPAPVVIAADDPLKVSVDSTLKNYPSVTATVSDGVVTLNGEIKKTDLQKLMMALNSLKPKKIDNKIKITIK